MLLRMGPPPFGFVKWMTSLSWNRLTSSMPGMVFTPSRFRVAWSRLSSVVDTLCTAFFFLQNKKAVKIAVSCKQELDA